MSCVWCAKTPAQSCEDWFDEPLREKNARLLKHQTAIINALDAVSARLDQLEKEIRTNLQTTLHTER